MHRYLILAILPALLLISKQLTAQTSPINTSSVIDAKRDCGALGDGIADDTLAIQRALDMAVGDTTLRFPETPRTAPRRVFIPAGTYRITSTLLMTSAHTNLRLEGAGAYGGPMRAMTRLLWDGDEQSVLMQSYGQLGLVMSDICFDGNHKAQAAFALDSIDKDTSDPQLLKRFGGRAGALHVVTRCTFANATVGYRCGKDSWTCASDMSFYDCTFSSCRTGFLTMADQNLNFLFMRPNVGMSNIGIHFAKGGSATINQLNGHSLRTALKIDKGGINAGTFSINGMRVESRPFGGYDKSPKRSFMNPSAPDSSDIRRTSLLDVAGETNVFVNGMLTTCMGIAGKNGDDQTPMIHVRDGAQLSIVASQFSGMIADIKTSSDKPASWLSIKDSRFRFLANPRQHITCDANSGYELTNSIVFDDYIDTEKGYRINGSQFIPLLQKLPANSQ